MGVTVQRAGSGELRRPDKKRPLSPHTDHADAGLEVVAGGVEHLLSVVRVAVAENDVIRSIKGGPATGREREVEVMLSSAVAERRGAKDKGKSSRSERDDTSVLRCESSHAFGPFLTSP